MTSCSTGEPRCKVFARNVRLSNVETNQCHTYPSISTCPSSPEPSLAQSLALLSLSRNPDLSTTPSAGPPSANQTPIGVGLSDFDILLALKRVYNYSDLKPEKAADERKGEIDHHKDDQLNKQKEGKGHWKRELASNSEATVPSMPIHIKCGEYPSANGCVG